MIYGYARVSTIGQTLDAQLDALRAAGAEKIFQEKASGVKADRPQLDRLLNTLEEDDQLLVTSLDRLARSTRDLLNITDAVNKAGATFKALNQPLADTTTPTGKLLVGLLALLAEFERSLIVERTTGGKRRAKAAGRKLGPKFKLTPHQRAEIIEALRKGETSGAELARRYNVSEATISRMNPQSC